MLTGPSRVEKIQFWNPGKVKLHVNLWNGVLCIHASMGSQRAPRSGHHRSWVGIYQTVIRCQPDWSLRLTDHWLSHFPACRTAPPIVWVTFTSFILDAIETSLSIWGIIEHQKLFMRRNPTIIQYNMKIWYCVCWDNSFWKRSSLLAKLWLTE